jgi:hypothetical protein
MLTPTLLLAFGRQRNSCDGQIVLLILVALEVVGLAREKTHSYAQNRSDESYIGTHS